MIEPYFTGIGWHTAVPRQEQTRHDLWRQRDPELIELPEASQSDAPRPPHRQCVHSIPCPTSLILWDPRSSTSMRRARRLWPAGRVLSTKATRTWDVQVRRLRVLRSYQREAQHPVVVSYDDLLISIPTYTFVLDVDWQSLRCFLQLVASTPPPSCSTDNPVRSQNWPQKNDPVTRRIPLPDPPWLSYRSFNRMVYVLVAIF